VRGSARWRRSGCRRKAKKLSRGTDLTSLSHHPKSRTLPKLVDAKRAAVNNIKLSPKMPAQQHQLNVTPPARRSLDPIGILEGGAVERPWGDAHARKYGRSNDAPQRGCGICGGRTHDVTVNMSAMTGGDIYATALKRQELSDGMMRRTNSPSKMSFEPDWFDVDRLC
jgi:hypothetical protein